MRSQACHDGVCENCDGTYLERRSDSNRTRTCQCACHPVREAAEREERLIASLDRLAFAVEGLEMRMRQQ